MSQSTQKSNKPRGILLSIALIIMAIHGIIGTVIYYAIRTQDVLERPWIITLMIIHSLLNILAAVAIWYWKKWGLYVYTVSTGISIVAGLVSIGMWSVFYMIFPFVILGWLLRTKWKNFE
jgi:hypothetical protein